MAEGERFVGIYQVHGDIREVQASTSGDAFEAIDKALFVAHQSFPHVDLDGIVFKVTSEYPMILEEAISVNYIGAKYVSEVKTE